MVPETFGQPVCPGQKLNQNSVFTSPVSLQERVAGILVLTLFTAESTCHDELSGRVRSVCLTTAEIPHHIERRQIGPALMGL
jgi:hypothetical protein